MIGWMIDWMVGLEGLCRIEPALSNNKKVGGPVSSCVGRFVTLKV